MSEQVDILIVGSGPSGISTALHLVQQDAAWAKRIVVVDKATHPREKLCGGGITHLGQNVLTRLGIPLAVPSFDVKEVRMVYQDKSYSFYGNPVLRIIRRDEFDHWLVKEAEKLGIEIRQGEAVKNITSQGAYVEVETEKELYQAKVLIAADGSRSFVRRALKWKDDSRVARLIEVLTPENPTVQPEFYDGIAIFDFTQMSDHALQGYYWDFPSFVDGKPYMNRGVFDSRVRPERDKADLKQTLADSLADREREMADCTLKGHPIRWWDKNGRFSIPRVLLVGDAAGADPLMGEGIAFALAYGEIAAEAVIDAFDRQDFSFETYRDRLLATTLFKQLDRRTKLARLAYVKRPSWMIRAGWQVARWVIPFTRWGDPDFVPADDPAVGN